MERGAYICTDECGFQRGDVVGVALDDFDALCDEGLRCRLAGISSASDSEGGIFEEFLGYGTALLLSILEYIYFWRCGRHTWTPVIPTVTINFVILLLLFFSTCDVGEVQR